MIRRILTACLVVAMATTGLASIASASADESSMASLINSERTSRGLNALEVYWDLTDDARTWTAQMIADGQISHNPNLAAVTSGWSSLGENVGVGPNVDRLHRAFMDSSGHRANILGDFNYVGVGADRAPDGNLYITVVFMKGPDGLVSPPTTTTTAPQTTTTTVAPPAPTTTSTPPAATATTTTTVPVAVATPSPSSSASKTPPQNPSASPASSDAPTVAAGHLSIDMRSVYPCTKGMILAPTVRMFCVV